MTIDTQLESIIEREKELKKEMAQLRDTKKQLQEKKKEQAKFEHISKFAPYVEKFAKLGIQLRCKSEYDDVLASLESMLDAYEVWYLDDDITTENLDKLLSQLEIAHYIEQHTSFKLIDTDEELVMEAYESCDRYRLHLECSNGVYSCTLTKESIDTEGEYIHEITPQLSIHVESAGYDGFYVTWVHKIAGTKHNIIDRINDALKVLNQM
jgi:hypothetical protein